MTPEFPDIKERRSPYIALVVVATLSVVVLWICWTNQSTTLLLVRHAEKGSDSNPTLTAAGENRAEALVHVAEGAGVVAVYATEWCRTALTAEPTAASLGLEIQIQPNANAGDQLEHCGVDQATALLDPSVASPADLVAHVLSAHRGRTVLIVGHSNTVPAMVEAAGAPTLCPDYFALIGGDCRIPDQPGNSEFHHLFVLEVPRWFGSTRLVKATYGD
ncbi:MAG: histidine phosphatase family protein [Acidobacteria bacterium]|nr:histidine phosphatase family protein [Acidobacteriota bacterium]